MSIIAVIGIVFAAALGVWLYVDYKIEAEKAGRGNRRKNSGLF